MLSSMQKQPIHPPDWSRMRRHIASCASLCAALVASWGPAHAAYPDRPITLVVPFAAGSGSDLVARIVAKGLADTIQATVVVDNRPGANGALGAQVVARAKPDGYTLLLGGSTTNAANYAFFPGKPGYEPAAFDFVGNMGSSDVFLFVSSTQTWKNMAELVTAAKRRPGTFSCGSGNAVTQVACEYFKHQADIDAVTVPYKSTPQSLMDLAGGQLSFAFADAAVAQAFLASGKIRAIAAAARQRSPAAPQVATFQEQGVAGFECPAWTAVFSPAGTPIAVAAKLNAALIAIFTSPAMARLRETTGSTATPMDLADGQRFVSREVQRWKRYIMEAGIRAEQ